ncbi:ribosome recycling factor domain-containing protein [Mycena albidolilacea]|uniref:Ribosome recycling factor domain-containing protein n=1 Tax=Mycena albidolilacea TaxID=1033008 RepID=A0AAD6ZS61_9AGAR|nr:ribosome recycling factor domain-containing protein [Mycena albidolilacea]
MFSLRQVALRARPNPNLCLRSAACARNVQISLACRAARLPSESRRGYASKHIKSTADLVPGSKQPITDEAARQEYTKTDQKMHAAVDWYRKECAGVESRATGRVTPEVLDAVRVRLPGSEKELHLNEVATVGVRDGSTLLITIFEEDNMKHVEKGLYDAKIPNIVPHKHDSRTIKIPIPKPTVESNTAMVTAVSRKSEDVRVQIRKLHQASLKRGNYKKHSIELEEFQKLTDRHIAEVDKIVTGLKKATTSGGKKK